MLTLLVYKPFKSGQLDITNNFLANIPQMLFVFQDVRREMAALVSVMWSNLRGNESFHAVQCVTCTNTPHEHTDHTHHESLQQQQVLAVLSNM